MTLPNFAENVFKQARFTGVQIMTTNQTLQHCVQRVHEKCPPSPPLPPCVHFIVIVQQTQIFVNFLAVITSNT